MAVASTIAPGSGDGPLTELLKADEAGRRLDDSEMEASGDPVEGVGAFIEGRDPSFEWSEPTR